MVGVPNRGEGRLAEDSPFDDTEGGPGRGSDYVNYLAGAIKGLVDARYRTLPEREATGIAGSSMGGLISLFAFFARTTWPTRWPSPPAPGSTRWWAPRPRREQHASSGGEGPRTGPGVRATSSCSASSGIPRRSPTRTTACTTCSPGSSGLPRGSNFRAGIRRPERAWPNRRSSTRNPASD
ncbi:MAG: hypothetical protein H0X69_08450 [Gemmatimonadales bacterium]|nr:hypothetical protein [Gemmatimonadales bacterium]